jgi:cellulose synthase (UDP-forming)
MVLSSGSTTPRGLSRRLRLAVTRTLWVCTVIAPMRYFGWRTTATENPSAMWCFYLFLFAEDLHFNAVALCYIPTWKPLHHTAPPPLSGRTVDVFIATSDEPWNCCAKRWSVH